MADNNGSTIQTLETMKSNIEQKNGLFESYSHQSIEIIESYQHIRDFEDIEEQLEGLIKIQLDLIEQLRERNKRRIPRTIIEQGEAVSFFKLIRKIRLKYPDIFWIFNSERYEEIDALLIDHDKALSEGDVVKAFGFARRINVRFNQFTQDEYGEEIIETLCFRLRKSNHDQKTVMKEFIKPADIFSQMSRNKIDTRTLTEVPDDYKPYIKRNTSNSSKMRSLTLDERGLFEELNSLIIKYFRKSDIAADILHRLSQKVKS